MKLSKEQNEKLGNELKRQYQYLLSKGFSENKAKLMVQTVVVKLFRKMEETNNERKEFNDSKSEDKPN